MRFGRITQYDQYEFVFVKQNEEKHYSLYTRHSHSDGTSRTGAYILIDMVLNRMAKGETLVLKHTDTHIHRGYHLLLKQGQHLVRMNLCRGLLIAASV